MKKALLISLISVVLITSGSIISAQTIDSVDMGNGYSNDVFYSLTNGEVKSEPRNNWDIAFYTSVMSAGIIVNDASEIELKIYPKADTNGWNNIDTTGLSTWPVLYNSEEDWEDGAFNRNGYGQLDYGWGIYNMVTHKLVGDSLFIIKLADTIYKKLWIVRKLSAQNIYQFRYANLDNSEEMEKEYNLMDYVTKNFVYYSITNDELIDREPNKESWDILWTKYIGAQPQGGVYPVTGILSNINIANNRFHPVSPDYTDWFTVPVDTTKSGIGWNWKKFDFGTLQYKIVDSLVFFVTNKNADVYKLYFNSFQIGTGKTIFVKEAISMADIIEYENKAPILKIHTNPVNKILSFNYSEVTGEKSVKITDLTGRAIYNNMLPDHGTDFYNLKVSQLMNGVYFLTIQTIEGRVTEKFIVKR